MNTKFFLLAVFLFIFHFQFVCAVPRYVRHTFVKYGAAARVEKTEIAGADGVFRPAFAEIRGKDKVAVYLPEIKQPVKVRFGWHETAVPNLVNSEGLPATPFICN